MRLMCSGIFNDQFITQSLLRVPVGDEPKFTGCINHLATVAP